MKSIDNIIIHHLFAGYEVNENSIYFGDVKMKTPQQHAQKILPLVIAQANGEVIQQYVETHGWLDCKEPTAFVDGCKYRVKPKTILVNGFEVPEPMREAPNDGVKYFFPNLSYNDYFWSHEWGNDGVDVRMLERGICHTTKEAAIAHAKAMLGINPNTDEQNGNSQGQGFVTRCVVIRPNGGE